MNQNPTEGKPTIPLDNSGLPDFDAPVSAWPRFDLAEAESYDRGFGHWDEGDFFDPCSDEGDVEVADA